MKKVFALVALAGIASVAVAAPKLSFQVSTDGGSTWGSSANALAGQAVQVRMVVDWTGTTAYGFSGTLAKIVYGNVDGSDGLQANGSANTLRSAPWAFGSAGTLRVTTSGSTTTVGLAGSGTTQGFISFGQQAPASAGASYSTANPAVIGAFTITVGAGRSLGSTLSIGGLVAQTQAGAAANAFQFHAAANSSNTSFRESGSVESGLITVVPTPGALALLGLGGLVTGRRRR
jgi:hypothetical protein